VRVASGRTSGYAIDARTMSHRGGSTMHRDLVEEEGVGQSVPDPLYHLRRAQQEHAMAVSAKSVVARAAHARLARLHLELAGSR